MSARAWCSALACAAVMYGTLALILLAVGVIG